MDSPGLPTRYVRRESNQWRQFPQQNRPPLHLHNDPRFVHTWNTKSTTRTYGNGSSGSDLSGSYPTLKVNSNSSNLAQRPTGKTPSKFSKWTTNWITDWWGIELICWFMAAFSLIAIVVMLETHKSKPLPEWPLGITINSFISIFATIGQMAMMKPVVECISQLKWLWFVRKERLSTFEAFDDASRGPTGSLIILGKLRGLHLISLGATITIISIAFGPFSQQVVSFPQRLQPVGIATTPSVFNYTGASDFDFLLANPGIVAAVYDGLGGTKPNLSTISSVCSTGNCTWNEYSSIGMCASVVDVSTSILNNTCNTTALEAIFEAQGTTNPGYPCYNYTLPYLGYTITDATYFLANVSVSNSQPQPVINGFLGMEVMSIAQAASNSSLVTYYIIYQPISRTGQTTPLSAPMAYSLTLDFCLHTYLTTVTDGAPNTILKSSQTYDLAIEQHLLSDGDDYSLRSNYTSITAAGANFTVSDLAATYLSIATQDVFIGDCLQLVKQVGEFAIDITGSEEFFCIPDAGTALINAISNSTDPFSAVAGIMDSIAISLTNTFRTGGAGDASVSQFEGTAFAPVGFVETQYLWLLLPTALVFLTLVFLLATIFKSQRLGSRVWKSSNLATLQGLHLDLHTKLGGLSSISEMHDTVEKIQVRFDMEGGKAEHGVDYRLLEAKRDEYWRG